jgi:Uma2 family endonuclease
MSAMQRTPTEWATVSLKDVPLPARLHTSVTLTDEELMAFSQANKPCQVERLATGELLVMTPNGYEGNRREIYIARELDLWAEKDGRGQAVGASAGFNLFDGSTLSPDAGWVSAERLTGLTPQQRERFLPFAPDFVIEILSPSDSLSALDRKMEQWLANGVTLAWRIDPYGETVAIYTAGREPALLHRPDVVQGSGPVEGFRLDMARIWPDR